VNAAWTRGNPASQGYCLPDGQLRALRFAVRFSTGLCLPLLAAALLLESPLMLLGLAAIGAVAGFTPRHPFDLLWNHGVRAVAPRAPELPRNPRRRRHAFKLGGAMALVVAGLFAIDLTTPALVLGSLLLCAATIATVFNFCIPSELMTRLERRGRRRPLPA
jgi:uncharacterized membrane protein